VLGSYTQRALARAEGLAGAVKVAAGHHVQHVYGKIGVSTRAGAALFAMEQGLLSR
jgi:hypothetical protein